ncbi:MAG TPA: hypothetical protein PKA55_06805 [Rhodoblastus sp.]|nr:hypothetical protein [Rhodoblastus sp.]
MTDVGHFLPPMSLAAAFFVYALSVEELTAWCHQVENLSCRAPPRFWAFVSVPAGLGGLFMYALVALAGFRLGLAPALVLLGVCLLAVAIDTVVFDVLFRRKRYWTRPVFLALFYGDAAYVFASFVIGAGLLPGMSVHWA